MLDSGRPVMSWINLGRSTTSSAVCRVSDDASEVVRDLRPQLLLDLPTTERVLEAARIKADHPMAYADAFAAATAIAHNATLLTGDPELLVTGAAWGTEDLRATAESDSDSE